MASTMNRRGSQSRGHRGTASKIIERVICATLTCVSAAVGSLVGAVTGALIGLATESGLLRGAGIGAISGAVFCIEAVESSLDLWNSRESGIWSLLYVIDIICSLLSGRIIREKVDPAMQSAVQSQMSAADLPSRIPISSRPTVPEGYRLTRWRSSQRPTSPPRVLKPQGRVCAARYAYRTSKSEKQRGDCPIVSTPSICRASMPGSSGMDLARFAGGMSTSLLLCKFLDLCEMYQRGRKESLIVESGEGEGNDDRETLGGGGDSGEAMRTAMAMVEEALNDSSDDGRSYEWQQ
ncbi:RING [Musa troglodytarum]|uniref:RING n=1 Tax=Musa troglodytarum TaxID=320322 RepID=A0A9E7HRW8_9LILI|nr:RING [Musa troglodytarum]